jgi:hypothetical protein
MLYVADEFGFLAFFCFFMKNLRVGGMAQVVQHLPSMCKVLYSIQYHKKKKGSEKTLVDINFYLKN